MNDLKTIYNKIKSKNSASGSEAVIVIEGLIADGSNEFLPSDNQISIQDAYKAYMSGTTLLLVLNFGEAALCTQVTGAVYSNGDIQLAGIIDEHQIIWGSEESSNDSGSEQLPVIG